MKLNFRPLTYIPAPRNLMVIALQIMKSFKSKSGWSLLFALKIPSSWYDKNQDDELLVDDLMTICPF